MRKSTIFGHKWTLNIILFIDYWQLFPSFGWFPHMHTLISAQILMGYWHLWISLSVRLSFLVLCPANSSHLGLPQIPGLSPILKETSNLHLTYFCCVNICSLSLGSKLEQWKWLKGWSLPVSHLQEIVVCCCLCSMSWEPLFHTFFLFFRLF